MLTKNQARTFFLGLSWHTLSQEIPKQTHEENLTESIIRGKKLFDVNDCMGCLTIIGEGAYYARELTKVIDRKGVEYNEYHKRNILLLVFCYFALGLRQ